MTPSVPREITSERQILYPDLAAADNLTALPSPNTETLDPPISAQQLARAGEALSEITERSFRVPRIFSSPSGSGEGSPSFQAELDRFQSTLQENPEGAAESLRRLQEAAGGLTTPPRGSLSDEGWRDHYTRSLQIWNVARNAFFQLRNALGRAPNVPLSDSQITDRMREAVEGLAQTLGGSADAQAVEDLRLQLIRSVEDAELGLSERLHPERLLEFLTGHELAQALAEGAGAEPAAPDAIGLYLSSAEQFTSLGLNDRATAALEAAWQRAESMPSAPAQYRAYLQIAGGFQSAGMRERANRAFVFVSLNGPSSSDPECRTLARFAQTFLDLNSGEFEAAEASLAQIPESETRRALAEEIREGSRRARVVQLLQIYQTLILLYSETHSFAEGVTRDEVRDELLGALQTAAQSVLSSEQPNLWEALRQSDGRELAHFLHDTRYGRALEAISDPGLDRREFRSRWLAMTDGFLEESDHAAVSLMAQLMREVPELRESAEAYHSRVELDISRMNLDRRKANFLGDWLFNLTTGILDSGRNFLSFMSAGAFGGSFEENLPGTAEFALLIATEGLSLEAEALFATSRVARTLHPVASRTMGWGVRSGSSALVFSAGGLAIDAAATRSLERLTVGEFSREFGANLVMFGLLHLAGVATHGQPATLRYASTVGSFVASDYVNESVGLRDPLDLPIANRLLNAVTMDAKVRFANWLGNHLTAGRFVRLRAAIAERYEENAEPRSSSRTISDAELINSILLVSMAGGPAGGSGGRPSASYEKATNTLRVRRSRVRDFLYIQDGELIPRLGRYGLDPSSQLELLSVLNGTPYEIRIDFEVNPHSSPAEVDALWRTDFPNLMMQEIRNTRHLNRRILEGDSIVLRLSFDRGRVRNMILAVPHPEFFTTEGALGDLLAEGTFRNFTPNRSLNGDVLRQFRFYRRSQEWITLHGHPIYIPGSGGDPISASNPVQIISPLTQGGLGEIRLARGTRRAVIGRSDGHFTWDTPISREHATLEFREEGGWYIRDGVINPDGNPRYSRNGVGILHLGTGKWRSAPRNTGNPEAEWLPISDGEAIFLGTKDFERDLFMYIFQPPLFPEAL